jgi:phospholipase A1
MEVVLFLPGILGSKLRSPDAEVWPPTPLEVLAGYKRINDLLRSDLTPSGVIESVCIDVYGRVLNALRGFGYHEDAASRRLIPYAYDWRRNILNLARDLDATLTQLVHDDPDVEIKLICHSMGGLVARACLESANAVGRPWAGAVKLAIFLATPHNGAPLAFARAIGVGGASLGLSEVDLRRLSAAPEYPASY